MRSIGKLLFREWCQAAGAEAEAATPCHLSHLDIIKAEQIKLAAVRAIEGSGQRAFLVRPFVLGPLASGRWHLNPRARPAWPPVRHAPRRARQSRSRTAPAARSGS